MRTTPSCHTKARTGGSSGSPAPATTTSPSRPAPAMWRSTSTTTTATPTMLMHCGPASLSSHGPRRTGPAALAPPLSTCKASQSLWPPVVKVHVVPSLSSFLRTVLMNRVSQPAFLTPDYEAILLRLGSDPVWYAAIRERTEARRARSPLYDMPRWTRHLQIALHSMWAAWNLERPRRDIYLTDNGTATLTPRDLARRHLHARGRLPPPGRALALTLSPHTSWSQPSGCFIDPEARC